MRIVALIVFTTALLLGCSTKSSELSPEDAGNLLLNRNWMNKWPSHKDERLHVFRFVPSMGGGVYQDRTLYLGLFELFHFDVKQSTLMFYMPDNNEHVKSRFRIEEVDGPEPFDLRLTIEPTPRGPAVYYGRRSETATTWHELDKLLPHAQDRHK